MEKDLVDSRALQQSRLEPVPGNASEFRLWKNALILMMGRIDVSGDGGDDYLSKWVTKVLRWME